MKHQLDFEKPIAELQSKLEELKKHRETHAIGVNFEEEIATIERKIAETRKQIFSKLTARQRAHLARHPTRPYHRPTPTPDLLHPPRLAARATGPAPSPPVLPRLPANHLCRFCRIARR